MQNNYGTLLRRHTAACTYVVLSLTMYLTSCLLHGAKVILAPYTLTDPAAASLDIVKGIATLTGTWAAALFAGAAAIAFKSIEKGDSWPPTDRAMLVAVLACGVLAYYGIYCGHIAMLGMVAAGAFSPLADDISRAVAIQYYAALTGTALLGMIFARMLDRRMAPAVTN